MKQVIQNYKTGDLDVEEVPMPLLKPGGLLVRNRCSLISTGTERMKILTASKNIFGKARARPDQVKLVMNNIKQEGFLATIKKALIKLDTPISLGYSCAGDVISVHPEVNTFKLKDRVACIGEGTAAHAEINFIPENLCTKIPDNLSYKEASFAGLGAIAMQGIRNACVDKGHKVGVIGLGLIGQLTIRILKAYECEVLGMDIDDYKLSLARESGFLHLANSLRDNVQSQVRDFTGGRGLDSVIITAASKDNKPIELAGKIAKKYGYVVLVGLVPIQIPRKEFFDKELIFVVSHGFGDESIQKDTCINKRRIWTAQENIKEFLSLVSKGLVKLDKLITHEFDIKEAQRAYHLISSKDKNVLGILLNYAEDTDTRQKIIVTQKKNIEKDVVNVGFIGAGSFSLGYLLPIFAKNKNVNLRGVSTSRGISSKSIAKKFEFNYATSESSDIINDPEIDCIVITTRHNLHSHFVVEGLKRGKIVFVEKPLCIKEEELRQIIDVYSELNGKLMIGFNRRFSPLVTKLKDFFSRRIGPLVINYRINAGYLENSHWLNDLKEGGGRIIGEVCHFLDLLQFIIGSHPTRLFAESIDKKDSQKSQNLIISMEFGDCSLGVINYNAIGDISYPRERIEVFGQDSVCVIDNFRKAEFVRNSKVKKISRFNRDMGYKNEINTFINCILNNEKMPISFKDIVSATYSTFRIIDSLKEGLPVNIDLIKLGL
jgi:polar amino acid transport system substrate-binding protein